MVDKNTKVWESIYDIANKVNNSELKAVDNVNKSLTRINDLDGEYNAIVSLIKDRALSKAQEIDKKISEGKNAGRLAGVPFIAKDNFLTFGSESTASSNMLKGFKSPYQSTAIEKLEAEGAICVGKANLDAFAHGGSTENSDIKVTKNPHDTTRVPGGSSGGSAASTALQYTPFALGTDTGGSIRQPASFCGVVGLKPTYGLVSRSGVVAMASSTDVIGPLTNTVDDAALVLDVMAGPDTLDGTTIKRDTESYDNTKLTLKNKKIGVIKEYFNSDNDSEAQKIVNESINLLAKNGAVVEEVSLPTLKLALAVYYIIVPAELSSNLSRHDGQRYEYSERNFKTLEESYTKSRTVGFGEEAKRRIMIGTHVLSSGYYDAYYKKAQIVRTKIINEFNQVFKKYDCLVGPVTPSTAFKIGENVDNPLHMYMQDIMTVSSNLAGIPSISVPCGEVDNLPVGLQIICQQNKDSELLGIAKLFEDLNK